MQKINIGKVVTTHGVRGEIKVYPHTNVDKMFDKLKKIYVGDEEKKVIAVKYAKGCPVIKLDGILTVEMAKELVGRQIFAEEKDLPKLEENSYYLKDIIGLTAVDETGSEIGKITDVIFTGANDVYEITTPEEREILVPAVKEFVLKISLENKTVTVKLIEGM